MNTRDNDPLHAAINAKLAEVVTALLKPPRRSSPAACAVRPRVG